jgi:pyrroline-5-carboxylate reductase
MRDGVRIGIVGGGRVTRILLGGWARAGRMQAEVVVADPDADARARLLRDHPSVRVTATAEDAAVADCVLLAVHPPVVPAALDALRGRLRADALVVYLGSKVTLARMRERLHGHGPLARVIPNAPSMVGAGHNPHAFAAEAVGVQRELLRGLFEPLGRWIEVDERLLEPYVLLTGMGPTYLWPQLQQLLDSARGMGLDDAAARAALEDMVVGAVRTLLHDGLPPEDTMDLVPVRPLDPDMPAILDAYRGRLAEVLARIRPEG